MSKTYEVRQSEPLHVLTVQKRLPGQAEVVRELAALLPKVEDVLSGPPMALRLGFPGEGGAEFDLAFPVSGPLEREGFLTKKLESYPAFSIPHEGPLADGAEGTNLSDSFGGFIEFLNETGVMLGDEPILFVYHAGLDTVGTDSERFSLEILYPYHTPTWLTAFRKGVTQCLDEEAAARVLAGSKDLEKAFDGPRTAEWVQAAVARLDEELPDEQAKACVLNGCSHTYIVESAQRMKSLWDASGHDLRKHMELVTAEPYFGATYRLDESADEPMIYITRAPANRKGWQEATDPIEKRYHACFCPLVRETIREQKDVSRSFCHCSSGWYIQEWEVVFGTPPRVDLVDTILEGKDHCVFAVHVPPGFLG